MLICHAHYGMENKGKFSLLFLFEIGITNISIYVVMYGENILY
jgi:hypothetical protein